MYTKVHFNMRPTCRRFFCDIFPSSEIRIIKNNNLNKKDNLKEKVTTKNSDKAKLNEHRLNEVNIQMVSQNIYDQLFKNPTASVDPHTIKRYS